jgi:orotidine-5'-phosphate decarboxylase
VTHWGDVVAVQLKEYGPVVVGIDPDLRHIPTCFRADPNLPRDYVHSLLDGVEGLTGFIKFQAAFFEAFGSAGMRELARAMADARSRNIRVILDAKRGDIGSTSEAYARAYLRPRNAGGTDFEVDCLTVNPFLGPDSLAPFFECAAEFGKGVFVLVKTSNPGATWLQDRIVEGKPVCEYIAESLLADVHRTTGASGLSAIGVVVGLTYPQQGARIRDRLPDAIILAPGYGAQGADIGAVSALQRNAGGGVLLPVSRGITSSTPLSASPGEFKQHTRSALSAIVAQLP